MVRPHASGGAANRSRPRGLAGLRTPRREYASYPHVDDRRSDLCNVLCRAAGSFRYCAHRVAFFLACSKLLRKGLMGSRNISPQGSTWMKRSKSMNRQLTLFLGADVSSREISVLALPHEEEIETALADLLIAAAITIRAPGGDDDK